MRSHRIEAFAAVIPLAVEARKDIALDGLVLAGARPRRALAGSAVHRFFARGAITFKKTVQACEQKRPNAADRRQAWLDG